MPPCGRITPRWFTRHWHRAVRSTRRWPPQRVGLAVVAAGLLLSAAWLGHVAPLLAQEGEAPAPEATGASGVTIRIDRLVDRITYTIVDRFQVQLSGLSASATYEVRVSSDGARLGIGGCGTAARSQTATVAGGTTQDLLFIVWACGLGAGTVTAEVREAGASRAEVTVSQDVTVLPIPDYVPAAERAAAERSLRGVSGATTPVKTPGIVKNLQHGRWATEIEYTWNEPGSGSFPLSGYGVLMWKGSEEHPGWGEAVNLPTSPRRKRYTGLELNTLYKFRIHACNYDRDNDVSYCGWWTDIHEVRTGKKPKPPHTISFDEAKTTSVRANWRIAADSGGVPRTGFLIRYWPQSNTSDTTTVHVTNASAQRHTLTGLTPDTAYDAKLRTCNDTQSCTVGDWSANHAFRTPPETTATHPGQVGQPTVDARDAALYVDWTAPGDGGAAISHHDLRYRAGTSGDWTQTRVPSTATETVPTDMTVSSLSNGTAYQVEVRACNTHGCGDWSPTATGTPSAALGEPPNTSPPDTTPPPPMCTSLPASPPPVPASLDAPANLDLTPSLTTRHAQLAWAPVSGAAKYKVEIRRLEQGSWGAWGAPDLSGSSTSSGEVTNATCYDINLDHIVQILSNRILPNATRGLGTNVAFGFKVKAINGVRESDFSNEVIVIDFSRAYANGDSRGYPVAGQGQSEVNWQRADQVLGSDYSSGQYSFRYRELRHISGPGAGELIHHSDPDWQPNAYVTIDTTNDNPKTGLTVGTIYGVQIRLDNTGPGGTTSVYAARDIYAWPHHESTYYRRHVVATHDFRLVPISRATSRDAIVYRYRICTDTFTFPTYMKPGSSTTYKAGDPTQWVPYINHALRQWQYATDGLVQMIHEVDENGDSLPCSDTLEFLTSIAKEYNDRKGKGETESDIDTHIASFLKMLKEEGIKGRRLGKALAKDLQLSEILMIDDVSGPIATLKERVFNNVSEHVGIPRCPAGCAVAEEHVDPERPLGRPIRTADIYLKRSSHWSESHTLLDMRGVEQIRLNTCPGTDPDNDREHYHKPYATLVHESGHALGLWHPTNLGPVMSYTPGVPRCSPHPFDVLALMALYQSRGERRV